MARPPDRLFRLVLESHDGRAPGADSEEKHEPVSDIDTVVVDSLKALDPEWPIREAYIHPCLLVLRHGTSAYESPAGGAGKTPIGVLLPRSGYMAPTGQGSHRGAMIAPKVLADYGHHVELVHIDTESNVDAARIAAERVINDGAHCIVGNVDSGGTMAIAQVCEQHQVPLVVNVGAAPQITEQGFKYVARNFPHAGMLMGGGLRLIKNLLDVTKLDAKTAVFFYANDTFGQAQRGALGCAVPACRLAVSSDRSHRLRSARPGSIARGQQNPRIQSGHRDGSHPRQRRGQADPRHGPSALLAEGDYFAWLVGNV